MAGGGLDFRQGCLDIQQVDKFFAPNCFVTLNYFITKNLDFKQGGVSIFSKSENDKIGAISLALKPTAY